MKKKNLKCFNLKCKCHELSGSLIAKVEVDQIMIGRNEDEMIFVWDEYSVAVLVTPDDEVYLDYHALKNSQEIIPLENSFAE